MSTQATKITTENRSVSNFSVQMKVHVVLYLQIKVQTSGNDHGTPVTDFPANWYDLNPLCCIHTAQNVIAQNDKSTC